MIERCGDRQRKCDGLEKWPFHLFVGSLPVMLQIALLLLACGLCRYMSSVNDTVAYTLITLTCFGVLFYVGVVVAGASSYDCPFQTPASAPLRALWKHVGPPLISLVLLTTIVLRALREMVQRQISRITTRLPPLDIIYHLRSLPEGTQLRIPHPSPTGPNIHPSFHRPLLPTIRGGPLSSISKGVIPWFSQGELAKIQAKNANDARCVSWVIRNITDPEALDAAIRRAATIRWFDDGIDAEHVYELIVSAFHACFGSDGEVYLGSRDRAYYSGQAILWIHTLAMCKSRTFPLPATQYRATGSEILQKLLDVIPTTSAEDRFGMLLLPRSGSSPSHSQWVSNLLLHQSWARIKPHDFWIRRHIRSIHKITMPLDALLNCLLMCCNLLGLPVEEEVLKIPDKSYVMMPPILALQVAHTSFTSDRLGQVLNQVTRAITSALNTPRYKPIGNTLLYLAKLENRPWWLAQMAYEWCALIWKNRQSCVDWEDLLFLSLEVGFRSLDPLKRWYLADLTHTEHHRELAGAVFKSNRPEAIADLLWALTVCDDRGPAVKLFSICKEHIVDLQINIPAPFPPRLQRLVMDSIALIGYKGFEEVGTERFVGLLNLLHIGVEETIIPIEWNSILLETAQSSEGCRHLTIQSWELLVKLTTSRPWRLSDTVYTPCVASSLLAAQEWDKLECWMGVVWMMWPPEIGDVPEDLERSTESLFRQRPGAVTKLTRWMEEWSRGREADVPESFERFCQRAHEAVGPLFVRWVCSDSHVGIVLLQVQFAI